VQTDPDTTPGVLSSQAEFVFGVITTVESRGGSWWYQVRANNDGRNHLWVPETRVRTVSKSVYGGMLEMRAFPVQERLRVEREKSDKLREKYNALRLECPILAGEISRLEAHITKLDNKILEIKDANKLLADDLRESSATTIFSRNEAVVGRNANAIRSKMPTSKRSAAMPTRQLAV